LGRFSATACQAAKHAQHRDRERVGFLIDHDYLL
jgi:hypothetical protein